MMGTMTPTKLTALPLIERGKMALPFLTLADVAAIWTEVRRRKAIAAGKTPPARPIGDRAVQSYLDKSKPADPRTGRPAGRYADDPVPTPVYVGRGVTGNRPIWVPGEGETIDDVMVRVAEWYARRPGQGVGGGRPRRTGTVPRQARGEG